MLVSAAIADGPPRTLLYEIADRRVQLVLPDPVMSELERVLTTKLGGARHWDRIERALLELDPEQPPRPREVEALTGDPNDDAILACAVQAKVDVLVTGDRKHLLPLGQHRGVRLLTPQALLAELV